MRRRGLWLAAVVACAVGLPVPAAQNKDLAVLEEFKIEKGGRPILVPVKIQGREYPFLLDTGMSVSALDVSFRKLLGEPIRKGEMGTPGGPVKVEFFQPPEASVGRLDLREGGPVLCLDMKRFRRAAGRDIRGVLGMGFLKRYVVRVDFNSGKAQFRSWDGRSHPEWGSAVSLYEAGEGWRDIPCVKGNLAGVGEIKFLVDSGCNNGGDLVTEIFEKARGKNAAPKRRVETAAGTHRFRTTRIRSLGLGGYEHRGLSMTEAQQTAIGLGLLGRYVVTLDFVGMKMYLRKGNGFDQPVATDMSGLSLGRSEGRTIVWSVERDSPAAAAGIRQEDVVHKVGKTSAAEMGLEDIREALKAGDGKKIKMTIKRGEEEKVVNLRLKKRV